MDVKEAVSKVFTILFEIASCAKSDNKLLAANRDKI
jgi:hypothetical protein